MKIIKHLLHYFFGRHKWIFFAKHYSGNDVIGHKESEYVFECKVCGKKKRIKVF